MYLYFITGYLTSACKVCLICIFMGPLAHRAPRRLPILPIAKPLLSNTPLANITASKCFLQSARNSIVVVRIFTHNSLQNTSSSAIFLGRLECLTLLRHTYRFSKTFMSRDGEGHPKSFNLCFLKQVTVSFEVFFGSLSCCTRQLFIFRFLIVCVIFSSSFF